MKMEEYPSTPTPIFKGFTKPTEYRGFETAQTFFGVLCVPSTALRTSLCGYITYFFVHFVFESTSSSFFAAPPRWLLCGSFFLRRGGLLCAA